MTAQPVSGIVIAVADVHYLMSVIDLLIESGHSRGAAPSPRLARLRNELAIATSAATHIDVSTEVLAGQDVIALSHDACTDVATAAAELGMTPDGVRWHCRRGSLHCHRVGRQYLISIDSVEALKAARDEKLRSA